MFDWKRWIREFDRWEEATAAFSEQVLRSPLLLNPLGATLTSAFRTKAIADRALQQLWSALGLPTRGEQERMLHALNQIESHLLDLREAIAGVARNAPAAPSSQARRTRKRGARREGR